MKGGFGLAFGIMLIAAYLTSIVDNLYHAAVGLLLACMFFPPVGMIDGMIVWYRWLNN